MNLLDKWNKNKFDVYKSDELTMLGLLNKLTKWVDEIIQNLSNKTDVNGDHKGTWQGLSRPTLSEEGLRSTVEQVVIDTKNLNDTIIDVEQTMVTKDELEIERKRIDTFSTLQSGSTTGDAELIDGRVGANGRIFSNIGNAIRGQYKNLENLLYSQVYGKEITNNYVDMEEISLGYIKGSGGLSTGQVDTATNSHKIVTLPIKYIKALKLVKGSTDLSSSMVYGDIYDKTINKVYCSFNNDNIDTWVEIKDEWKINGELRLNWFNYTTSPYTSSCYVQYVDVRSITTNIVEELNSKNINVYQHCVNKPFSFNGKNAIFFGDSIVKGYTDSTTITPNNFPKLFSEKVGMAFTNHGVGGSCLSIDYNNLGSILDKIRSVDITNTDYIFIAGGVNDWQLAVNLDTFKTGVSAICEYLKSNFSGQVIFITPINHGGRKPINTPIADLQEYRNILTEIVMEYNEYSIIQGNLFNIPNEYSDEDYINSMFGDKLHPTELGYTVYARELTTILC